MRLVDADALLEAIQDDWCKFCEYKQDRIHCLKMCNVYDVRRDIEDFPDAGEVAPVVHAHWEITKLTAKWIFVCSHCRYGWYESYEGEDIAWKYCPDCGAIMDEEVDHE